MNNTTTKNGNMSTHRNIISTIINKNIHVLGFTGKMLSGKSTAAEYILTILGKEHPAKIISYADPLKHMMIDYLGFTKHQLYDQEGKKEYNDFWEMTNREAMQRVGTECFRNNFHPDTWIKTMLVAISKCEPNSYVLVPDVRFDNEYQLIHDLGGKTILIERPNLDNSNTYNQHASEKGCKFDETVVNDKDIAYFHEQLIALLDRLVV